MKEALNLSDKDYEIVTKSWRYLFDFLKAANDGTQIISGLVKFTKCGEDSFLAEYQNEQLQFEFEPSIDRDDLFEEILGLIKESKIVKIPTV